MRRTGFGNAATWTALEKPPCARRGIVTVTASRAISSFSSSARALGASGASYRAPVSGDPCRGRVVFSVKPPCLSEERLRQISSPHLPFLYAAARRVSLQATHVTSANSPVIRSKAGARSAAARIASGASGGGFACLVGSTGRALRYASSSAVTLLLFVRIFAPSFPCADSFRFTPTAEARSSSEHSSRQFAHLHVRWERSRIRSRLCPRTL